MKVKVKAFMKLKVKAKQLAKNETKVNSCSLGSYTVKPDWFVSLTPPAQRWHWNPVQTRPSSDSCRYQIPICPQWYQTASPHWNVRSYSGSSSRLPSPPSSGLRGAEVSAENKARVTLALKYFSIGTKYILCIICCIGHLSTIEIARTVWS